MKSEQNPECVGFIMDGNRRWAKSKNLPTLEGHRAGYEALLRTIRAVGEAQIPHMVCYAFSTENWKRTEEEVGYLMNLIQYALSELPNIFQKENKRINVHIIGEIERLSKELQDAIKDIESKNHTNPELTVWIALSYGGRAEIIHAVNRAVELRQQVTEETFGTHLWTYGMPDPDLVIRTSVEIRTSNFLIWQAAYSEYFFVDTFWPDFGETELKSILEQYTMRQRRRGA